MAISLLALLWAAVPLEALARPVDRAGLMQTLSETIRFASGKLHPVDYSGRSSAAADFDGDGAQDIAVMQGQNVLLLPNQGGGALGDSIPVDMGGWLRAFVAVDLDRDGEMDLVGAESDGSTHALRLRRGQSGFDFGAAAAVPLGAPPSDLAAGDLDRDGDADLVVVSAEVDSLWMFPGDGLGGLGEPVAVALPHPTATVVLADLRSDGAPEVVALAAITPNAFTILLNDGAGALTVHQTVARVGLDVTAFHAGGDGHLDLALIANDSVLVARGDGTGAVSEPIGVAWYRYEGYDFEARPSIRTLDIDRDGIDDLAYSSRPQGYWSERNYATVLIGRGDGTFEAAEDYVTPYRPEQVVVADLDGDEWPDLAVLAQGRRHDPFTDPRGVTVLMNYRDGALAGAMEYQFDIGRTVQAPFPGALGAARIRSRPTPDLIVTDSHQTLVLLKGRGNLFSAPLPVGPGRFAAAHDLEGDGLEDLLLASGDTVWTWRSLGDGTFAPLATLEGGAWVGLADFDADGRLDLAVRLADRRLAIRRGMPDGSFGALEGQGLYFREAERYVHTVADLDGDGRADVLNAFAAGTDSLRVAFNLGGGEYTDSTYFELPRSQDYCCYPPQQITVGDLDRDEAPDIVVLTGGGNGNDRYGDLHLFMNQGTRTFTSQGIHSAGNTPSDVRLADLNRDGLLEVLTINANGGVTFHFYFHENGGGMLLPWERYRVSDLPTNLVAADFDGDQLPDIVAYSPRWGSVMLVRNESIPSIATPVAVSVVSSEVVGGAVQLAWHLRIDSGTEVRVWRRSENGPWRVVGARVGWSGDLLRFDDPAALAGVRYGYRLGITEGGDEVFFGETWIEVPSLLSFELKGAVPNPSRGEPFAQFALPRGGSVRLELLDIAGRRVRDRRLEGLAPGTHQVRLDGAAALRPGVYLLRATHEGRAQSTRVTVAG